MFGFGRRLHRSRETIRKYFAWAGCAVPGYWLKNDVVATLRVWRTIPRPVEGDEDSITVARRKLLLVVANHCIRRPMGRKCGNGTNLARANAGRLAAIAAVFRRQNQLFHERIVVALGPTVISFCSQKQQLFSR